MACRPSVEPEVDAALAGNIHLLPIELLAQTNFDIVAAVDLAREGSTHVQEDVVGVRLAGKLNLSTVGPTNAQLVRNDIDNAEQALMFEQLMGAMADHDLREAAAEEEVKPIPRLRRRR